MISKIYVNSAIVKAVKYSGVAGGTAAGLAATAVATASTAGWGTYTVGGVSAATNLPDDHGAIITFSKKVSLVRYDQQ